jgi:hypothetical protein
VVVIGRRENRTRHRRHCSVILVVQRRGPAQAL